MIIKQVSVFVENRPGRLSEIVDILAKNGVNMRALSIADTMDFGILRIIVDEPDKVMLMLRENKITATAADVLAVRLEDKPGALSELLGALAKEGISVEYIYAFVARQDDGAAYVVIRVEDNDKAQQVVEKLGFSGIEKICFCGTVGIYRAFLGE